METIDKILSKLSVIRADLLTNWDVERAMGGNVVKEAHLRGELAGVEIAMHVIYDYLSQDPPKTPPVPAPDGDKG